MPLNTSIFKWRNVTWWHVKIFTSHTSKCQIKKEDMTVILLRIFFKGAEYGERVTQDISEIIQLWMIPQLGGWTEALYLNCEKLLRRRTDYNWGNRETDANTGSGHRTLFQRTKGFNVWENLGNFISYRAVLISWNTIWCSVWNMINLFIIHFLPIHC